MTPLRTTVVMKTDISGSTARFRELLAADLQQLLGEHRSFLAGHADRHGGRILKPAGDGFWLEFSSVTAAARQSCPHFSTGTLPSNPKSIHRPRPSAATSDSLSVCSSRSRVFAQLARARIFQKSLGELRICCDRADFFDEVIGFLRDNIDLFNRVADHSHLHRKAPIVNDHDGSLKCIS